MNAKSIGNRLLASALLAASAMVWSPCTLADPAPQDRGDEQPIVLEARPIRAVKVPPRQPEPFPSTQGDDYRIGQQDLLEIRVFGVDELDQTVRVSGDGSITMPLLGRLDVAGLSKTEVERTIAGMLSERFVQDPQVTVFIKEFESRKVAVSGEVREPGTYEMLGSKTLLEMISMAGGLGAELGEEIIIFRRGDGNQTERLAVDLTRLVYQADPSVNLTVQPGDIIYVPAVEKIRIFVSGAVNSPNLYEVPRNEPVTVLKAITLAGGTTERAADKRIQIMRSAEDGSLVSLNVNLRKVRRGKEEDLVLQPDDIVLVPEAFF